jgi:hypothetical protein
MTRPAVLTSNYDHRRQSMTYKVAIEGTGKFLLFTEDTLRDLRSQINEAMKGNNDRVRA